MPCLGSSNTSAIRRVLGAPERAKVPIPVMINDYNQYKIGVDVADQYRSYYFTQLKCLWNWPPIFYWLLETTVINFYLLAQQFPSPSKYHGCSGTFHLILAESIVTKYASSQVSRRPRKAYYTPKTSTPHYSKQQQRTKLFPPTC